MSSHKKKRNSALLYEFLVSTISRALVEGDKGKSNKALKVLKKHFKKGTELHKELRLVQALRRTSVNTEGVAVRIMQEAKRAARSHDTASLDREKSLLIRDINHVVKDPTFYDQQVNEYKLLATLQTVINDWRAAEPNLSRLAEYEEKVVSHLLSEKVRVDGPTVSEESPGTARLLMKVMMQKLNEKYVGTMSEQQRSLVRAYAFSMTNDDSSSIRMKLEEVRTSLIESINETLDSSGSSYINPKLVEARKALEEEDLSLVDDATVTRFMLYSSLNEELQSSDEHEGTK